ncbi:hypothetical protein [Demequina soli]|uniref:hypothetical protein n=1 Tax=Demequina soli TaxID=1638987 RepID=UPI0007832DB8|nr:hypothetical protein [Demequina soli]
MNKTRITLTAALCGSVLLAGCSSGGAAESQPDASSSGDAVLGSVPGGQGGDRQPSGVTGEIAYVSDGTAQVQDGSSQTAVRFGSDTAFTRQVDLALGDVAGGQCVVAMLGDDDTATTITVTDAADDGTCATGLGGMGGGPGGDGQMPTDMPSGMPTDGEMPTDLPSGAPALAGDGTQTGDAMPSGGFDPSSIVAGTVTSVKDDALVVEASDGTATTVTVGADTAITGTEAADADAVTVGMCMTAGGEADSSGGYDATTVYVFDAGDAGCVSTTGFGGRGGFRGGDRGAMPGGSTDTSGQS